MRSLKQIKQQSYAGKVVSRDGRRYTVLTDDGRTIIASSTTIYPPMARVTVLADVITGPAGKPPSTTIYRE